MARNTPHKRVQHQLQKALTTGVPVLEFVDDNPLDNLGTNTRSYQSDILTGETEIHAGTRIADLLIKSRKDAQLDCSYAIEVIDTSPPDFPALINHLRSGYAIVLIYIVTDDSIKNLSNKPLVRSVETNLTTGNYSPGWVNINEQTVSLGTILSLNNTRYIIKSWANELTPRLNSNYTWIFKETVVPSIPIQYPLTRVGMFDVVEPNCMDCFTPGLYKGYHDHTQDDPVVYLVNDNQEYVKLEHSDLQTIQNKRALSRVTPLPGRTPYF